MFKKMAVVASLLLVLPLGSCALFEELYGSPIDELGNLAVIPLNFTLPQPVTLLFPTVDFSELPMDPETGRVRFAPVYESVDLSERVDQALSAVGARLRSVRLVGVRVDIEDNQLVRDADPLLVQIGTENQSQDDAPDVAQTPLFTPDMTGTHNGEVFDPAEDALTSMNFNVGLATTIDPNNPPGGVLRFTLTLQLEIRPEVN